MHPDDLPNDPEALKRMLLEQLAKAEELRASRDEAVASHTALAVEYAEAVATRDELAARHAEVLTELANLKHRMFGRRRERVSDDQVQLFKESDDPAAAVEAATRPATTPAKSSRKKRGGGGRRGFPSHLPRIPITNKNAGPTTCEGCGGDMKVIGEDRSERLDVVPAQVRVLVVVRQKRACPCCPERGVVTQPAPPFALDKAAVGDSLLARVITDKYADHIPLNRQAKRFLRDDGVDIAVSTMCGWLRRTAGLLKHVVAVMRDELLEGHFLQSDATGLPILHGAKNQPLRGHLWSYTDGLQVVFQASTDGRQDHPEAMLEGFQGTLLTDGAGAYNAAAAATGVTRAGCWAHARRKFFEARNEDPIRAGIALATIREIFVAERAARDLEPDDRARFRREYLAERLARFRTLLDTWSTTCRPKSAMGKAITYARGQWDTLVVFLTDGTAPPHNNTSERLLRGPVVGRKNWLFAGSTGGAHAAATFFSIVASCEMAGVDPFAYLRDVLSLLPDAKPAELRTLTPKAWAAEFGENAA
jgi:transposase